ncbi:2-oxoacid:acceptor oxidoreductase subunit alpha [Candidatus Contubernalis alkaliaceticus]|uniref:2-oxoacid:acceptor oxidoreductase subunit alpha n=1 Tax=Candidatus Contubernalis alkaliaceticus TaxID=338645 RepID=UPI001F4BDE8B|nr:2-oxoacid:acceptor oxidoreductase subunit alpha [Candidatus Contubernalis alkalaceticus]UNC93344.1 2-oxoacid:acceptor oxidoreductase subunit alpha [Candidatus Contubernalis alkalaceticus]
MEINVLIGGAAGQGVDTVAALLSKVLVRSGYGLCSHRDYMSRVRGGHNFSRLRIASKTPWCIGESADILVALNEETYTVHRSRLTEGSRVVYDPDSFSLPSEEERGIAVRLQGLAKESGSAVMANTVAVGAVLLLLGLNLTAAEELLEQMFAHKEGMVDKNITALKKGYSEASNHCSQCFSLPEKEAEGKRLFIDGSEVLGMSALASGCRFLSAYPMTPSTGIMNYLAGKQQYGVVVEQAEDEIAAINMILGASFAGVRSMTCTSGGGFALMVEGLSLAGMTETPVVIIMGMRPGPATGLPTRTEQGDLEFVMHGGHGEFPRAILSATHLEDAFYRLNKAFYLADRYQLPVIFLTDQNFADTACSIEPFDFQRLNYERYLVEQKDLVIPYWRYRITDDGISPRALPGQFPGEVVLADSDEHDEKGNIIEDAHTRRQMVEKRLRKQMGLASEMEEPVLYGHGEPDILLLGWGSTYGSLREAVDALEARGRKAASLHFSDLWPLPVKTVSQIIPSVRKSFCVENNATGQFASLLRREIGYEVDHKILKYDGRPFMVDEILQEVEKNV